MKPIKYFLLALLTLSLVSCFEMEETIQINENNSGNYIMKIDMGQVLSSMGGLMQAQEGGEKKPEKMDSTIYFKDSVMASSDLTPEEKELVKNGSLRMQMDEKNHQMLITFTFPFTNMLQLKELKEKGMDIVQKIDKKRRSEESDPSNPFGGGGLDQMNMLSTPGSKAGDFSAAPGRITYFIPDKAAMAQAMQNDSAAQMLQQMSSLMGSANFRTIVQLPRPATNTSNNAKLSADKKTITISYSFDELMKNPALMEYEINY